MITQAIHLLTLHLMWKAQALTSNPDPSADEIKFRETLREQRTFLLEKVTEYAIGTQSNTIDGVKRAVKCILKSSALHCSFCLQAFHSLINLHILFCPSRTTTPDGGLLPTASLALTLDDEVQYRCAGFIQAEIEMFSEGIDDGQAEKDVTSDEELTSDDDAPRPEEGEGSGERVVKAKTTGHGTKGLTPTS